MPYPCPGAAAAISARCVHHQHPKNRVVPQFGSRGSTGWSQLRGHEAGEGDRAAGARCGLCSAAGSSARRLLPPRAWSREAAPKSTSFLPKSSPSPQAAWGHNHQTTPCHGNGTGSKRAGCHLPAPPASIRAPGTPMGPRPQGKRGRGPRSLPMFGGKKGHEAPRAPAQPWLPPPPPAPTRVLLLPSTPKKLQPQAEMLETRSSPGNAGRLLPARRAGNEAQAAAKTSAPPFIFISSSSGPYSSDWHALNATPGTGLDGAEEGQSGPCRASCRKKRFGGPAGCGAPSSKM